MTKMKSTTTRLDALLPLLEVQQEELHVQAAVLEVLEPTQLLELASNAKIRPFLLARLSDTVALVDPGEEHALAKVLQAQGYTPRLAQGLD